MLKFIHIPVIIALAIFPYARAYAWNNARQAFSTWPDTGQTTCYDDEGVILDTCPSPGQPFYGQDAQYAGPARSYTKLDIFGTVLPVSATSWSMIRDNVTGLIWEAKVAGDSIQNYASPRDRDNTYAWCDTNPETNGGDQGTCDDNNTEDFLNALNSSAFGGYTDWRLPTIKELTTLVDRGRYDQAIDPTYFPLTVSSRYWSSTTLSDDSLGARIVLFSSGDDYKSGKSASNFVRAVRGRKVPPDDRFVDNQDGTVTDTVTCLEWQQAPADSAGDGTPDYLSWQEALAYSENLTFAGHDDWRLPDVNELRSIVDYSRDPVLIYPTIFPETGTFDYWTSTTEAKIPDHAFLVPFYNEYDGDGTKSYHYRVRAVRGRQCGGGDHFPWPLFMPAIQKQRRH